MKMAWGVVGLGSVDLRASSTCANSSITERICAMVLQVSKIDIMILRRHPSTWMLLLSWAPVEHMVFKL